MEVAGRHLHVVDAGLCECGCGGATSIAKKTRARLGHVKGQPVRFIVGHALRGKQLVDPREPAPSVGAGRLRAERTVPLRACDRCGAPGYDRHHVDGDARNSDSANIAVLRRRCHMIVDGRMEGFVAAGGGRKRAA